MAVGSSCCEVESNGRNPSVMNRVMFMVINITFITIRSIVERREIREGAKTSHYDLMEWATFVLQERDKGKRR